MSSTSSFAGFDFWGNSRNFWEYVFEILDEVLFKSTVLCVDMLRMFFALVNSIL